MNSNEILASRPAVQTECAVTAVVPLFEQLSPAHVAQLDRYYAADSRFKDPFNEVQGVPAIRSIFTHMFATLRAPRFIVTGRVVQGHQAFLTWEFRFYFQRWNKQTEQCVLGASHLEFNSDGLVVLHRDYWDAAEELYEKLPVVGSLMRWLRRQAST